MGYQSMGFFHMGWQSHASKFKTDVASRAFLSSLHLIKKTTFFYSELLWQENGKCKYL